MVRRLEVYNRFDCGFFISILVIFKSVSVTTEHDYFDVHRTDKQMSLESCLGGFDVHSNTIIRTGESQAIGGKFLQGLELETPEKCQRLCCETGNCDVYVFEEKNDGYCYLFQCGSPKNFHCKFTRHPNYTSALITQYKSVLTTTPRPISHTFLTNISTQEQELINLKIKPEKTIFSSTSQPIEAVTGENRLMAATATENRNLSCGRFEFPCHSGECIAVYNACNGIPQCVDGSDEGPECSASTNAINANLHHLENLKSEIVQQVPAFRHNLKNFQQASIDAPFVENKESLVSAPTVWVNEKTETDSQPNIDRETFGRKSNMKTPNKNTISLDEPNEKSFSNQREMYVELPAVKSSFPTPQIAEPTAHVFVSNVRWPSQRQQWQIGSQGSLYSTHDQSIHTNLDKNIIHEQKINDVSGVANDNYVLKPNIHNNANYQEKIADYTDYPEKSVDISNKAAVLVQPKHEVSKTSTLLKEATHSSIAEQYKQIEQHLEIKFTDHDGHSEKPRGAVLSLTLGLLVTGIIVVLIGCRLRTVGRRGNRHGGKVTYAPDEDFLVNGMYL